MIPKAYTMGGVQQVLKGQSIIVRIFFGAPSLFLLEPKKPDIFLSHCIPAELMLTKRCIKEEYLEEYESLPEMLRCCPINEKQNITVSNVWIILIPPSVLIYWWSHSHYPLLMVP